MLEDITPLILTLDEAPNIGRTLEKLSWAGDIVVVDSYSQDETCAIVRRFPNTRLFQRRFDSHACQWNFGLHETGISTSWVLALDADFVVPEAATREISTIAAGPGISGYRASFNYCIAGHPLRGAAYPPVVVLYRRGNARYFQDGHTQRVRIDSGEILALNEPLLHDDRKPLRRWLQSQHRYMRLESAKLVGSRFADLRLQDKVRRMLFVAPPAMLFYCLFAKGNILDGRAGLTYALQRTIAELILSYYLLREAISTTRSTT